MTHPDPAASPIVRRTGAPDIVLRFAPDVATLGTQGLTQRGLVIIDKPAGCTSHDVVDQVRKILKMKRVGHSGTLDPEVTGVLPVGLGQATRVLGLLLAAGKTYDTRMLVHADLPEAGVREVLEAQVGTITQLPPVRSRVKRVHREREIYGLRIDSIGGREVRFTVQCEAGTYIRKLCHDVGEALGCGAHMAGLRRLEAGGFTLEDCVTLEALATAVAAWREGGDDTALRSMLRPLETALGELPRIWMHEGALTPIATGSPLALPGVFGVTDDLTAGEDCALMTPDGRLVALAIADVNADVVVDQPRGIAARPRKVFWPPPE